MTNSLKELADREFRRARPLVIVSDGMAPTLRPRRDVAMVLPATSYCGVAGRLEFFDREAYESFVDMIQAEGA